jgi:RNA polymerase sigma-70 factor (ECF subfamily)
VVSAVATCLVEMIGLTTGDTPQVRAWVSAAQAGDRAAFDALVALYYRPVYRTAMAALQRSEDAEDATQDAFVLAWRKVSAFRGDSTFKTWLLTIVWRQALDRRKARDSWWRRRHTPAVSEDSAWDDGLDRMATGDADPERVAGARARLTQARAAIAGLSPKLRDTLLLACSGEYGYDEIATMLGVPVGTVKWRVAEARRLLNKELS